MFVKFPKAWHHVDSIIGMVDTPDRTYILQKDGKWRYHTAAASELPTEIVEFPPNRTISVGHIAGKEIIIGKLYLLNPDISGYLYEKEGDTHIPGPNWHITVHGTTLTELIED